MKIPDSPRKLFTWVIAIFIFGLLITLPIQYFTTQSYWSSLNSLLSVSAVGWIRWWISIFPEPIAGFLGIYIAFQLDRKYEKRLEDNRFRETLPYIYFELIENKCYIDDYIKNPEDFIAKSKQFKDSNWIMFREDIKIWPDEVIVPLTRIFFNLFEIRRDINNGAFESAKYTLLRKVGQVQRMIDKQIQELNSQYFTKRRFLLELRNVLDLYSQLFENEITNRRRINEEYNFELAKRNAPRRTNE